jgi:uncharacterized membrane protein
MKKLFFILIALALLSIGFASAVNLDITSVEINNKNILEANGRTNNYKYERGEELNIDVCVQALTNVEDAQIEVDIYGYRYSNKDTSKVSDTSNTFNLDEGDNDCETLNLQVPAKMEMDYYKLRVRVGDRDGTAVEKDFELHVQGVDQANAVEIKDYTLDPESVIAGRAFTAMVKVRNIGDYDLEDLKATVSIPDLDVKATEYMDNLDADESRTFEELLLRIPECTKAGTYDVTINVEFDEYEETEVQTYVKVLKGETCGATGTSGTGATAGQELSTITVPSMQELTQGNSVVYPIMINNQNNVARTYTIMVSGVSAWGNSRIEPSSVVIVPSGQSKTTYLSVQANKDADVGDKVFTVTIDSGIESKQVSLVAKLNKGTTNSSTNYTEYAGALEIGLVVVVIILLIIGLIIGFKKLKDNKQDTEPYY